MKTNIYILIIALTSCLISCEKELTNSLELSEEGVISAMEAYSEIEDGRLSFTDKSHFDNFYRDAREVDEEVFASNMESKFYTKDFYSLMPMVTEVNAEKQFDRHVSKLQDNGIRSKSSKGSLLNKKDYSNGQEILENIFGEELFASLLNQNGEIAVGKKIYKYTDVGLFIVKKKQIKKLYNYLQNEGVSLNFMELTPQNIREKYISNARSASRECEPIQKSFDDSRSGLRNAEYFIAPDGCGGGGGTGGGTGGSGGSSNSAATPDEINSALNRISPCSIKRPWLSNLFGSVRYCEDRYDGNHRVKTKFFSSKYLLAYHIGYKVKHQKKGWTGLWRKQKTEQMAAGVNSVTWSFKPEISGYPQYKFPTNYWIGSTGELFASSTSYYAAKYIGKGNIPLPEIPFVRDADVIVELLVNDVDQFKTERSVRDFFYSNLFDTAKNVLKSSRNKELRDVAVIMNTPTQTWIQYYNFAFQCTNCDKFDKTFDWNVLTPYITYNFGSTNGFGGGKFNFQAKFDFKNPEVTGINGYGLAKRGGKWHGSKLVF